MHVVSIILQVLVGICFLLFGSTKFYSKVMSDEFTRYGYPPGFRILTGIIEIVGALGLLVGIWQTTWAAWAGLLLAVTMFFAILTHVFKVKDPLFVAIRPLFFLILTVIIWLVNW